MSKDKVSLLSAEAHEFHKDRDLRFTVHDFVRTHPHPVDDNPPLCLAKTTMTKNFVVLMHTCGFGERHGDPLK